MSDPESVSSGGEKFLSKKLGPASVQTWIVIVGGVAIVGYMIYRKRTAAATPLTTDSFTNPNANSIDSVGGNSRSGGVTTPNGTPSAMTNAQWAQNVANQLIAQGDNPTDVSNALSNYLNGENLSAAESALVAVGITQFGEPPQGVLPINQVTSTTTGGAQPFATPKLISRQDAAGTQYALVSANGVYQQSSNPGVIQDWVSKYGQAADLSWQQWADAITGNSTPLSVVMKNDPSGTTYALTGPGYFEESQQPGVWQSWVQTFGPAKNLTYEQYGNAEAAARQGAPTTTSTTTHTYTAMNGDTLQSISQRFLGTSDTTRLQAANPTLTGIITPGTVINIPV